MVQQQTVFAKQEEVQGGGKPGFDCRQKGGAKAPTRAGRFEKKGGKS